MRRADASYDFPIDARIPGGRLVAAARVNVGGQGSVLGIVHSAGGHGYSADSILPIRVDWCSFVVPLPIREIGAIRDSPFVCFVCFVCFVVILFEDDDEEDERGVSSAS